MLMNMRHEMKQRYRVFRRIWGACCCPDFVTKNQKSLNTRDRDEAYRLVTLLNESEVQSTFSWQLARVCWKAGDPAGATRTWQHIMDEIPKLKRNGATRRRWYMANKDKALDINWRPWPSLPKKLWPAVTFNSKRAITWVEHRAVVSREGTRGWPQLNCRR
jgi:hypothetical protein